MRVTVIQSGATITPDGAGAATITQGVNVSNPTTYTVVYADSSVSKGKDYAIMVVRLADRNNPESYTINNANTLFLNQAVSVKGSVSFDMVYPKEVADSAILLTGPDLARPMLLGTVTLRDTGNRTIELADVAAKTYGDAPFDMVATVKDAYGDTISTSLKWTSANPDVATVDENTGRVTIKGAGTTVIKATALAISGVSEEVSDSKTITVAPKTVTLTWSNYEDRTYDGTPSDVRATADGLVSGDSCNVTVIGGAGTNAGSYVARATGLDNRNYVIDAGAVKEQVYTINKASRSNPAVSDASIKLNYAAGTYQIVVTSPTDLDGSAAAGATYEVNDSSVISVNSRGLITGIKNGTALVTVRLPETTNYLAASGSTNITVTVVKTPIDGVTLTSTNPSDAVKSEVGLTNIKVAGLASGTITMNLDTAPGADTSALPALSISKDSAGSYVAVPSSFTLEGITYTIDVSGLKAAPDDIAIEAAATNASADTSIAASDASKAEAIALSVTSNDASLVAGSAPLVTDIEKRLSTIVGAKADALAAEGLGRDAGGNANYAIVADLYFDVKAMTYDEAGRKLVLDIKPMYILYAKETTGYGTNTVKPSGKQVVLESGQIANTMISGSVNVTVTVPSPFIRATSDMVSVQHLNMAGGVIKTIKPSIAANGSKFDVTFASDGFSPYAIVIDTRTATVKYHKADGSIATVTYDPSKIGGNLASDSKAGATFKGWATTEGASAAEYSGVLTDTDLTELDNLRKTLGTEIELYPVFSAVSGGAGGGGAAGGAGGAGGGGEETLPPEIVEPLPIEDVICKDFPDIDVESWFHDAVHNAIEKGYMNGYDTGFFGPNDRLSRAQLAQILYNIEGRPAAVTDMVFPDVDPLAWYSSAINWAYSRGIVTGYDTGCFGPDDSINRQQLATMLYRYMGSPGARGDFSQFWDGDTVWEYAIDSMTWATSTGVITGNGDTTFLDPLGFATRAQVATMLMRIL